MILFSLIGSNFTNLPIRFLAFVPLNCSPTIGSEIKAYPSDIFEIFNKYTKQLVTS